MDGRDAPRPLGRDRGQGTSYPSAGGGHLSLRGRSARMREGVLRPGHLTPPDHDREISMVTRREFLQYAVAAASAPGGGRPRQSDMAYRRLGRTNCMISEFVCGGNTISPSNNQHVELAI